MLKDSIYSPSVEDRKLFSQIIAAVQSNPDWFAPAAAALDRDYSTQAIRGRLAAELREHRAIPHHIKRSRAFRRKYCQLDYLSQQLGFALTPADVIPGPPKRLKGEDGKPLQPDMPLRIRFGWAFQDMLEDDTDLSVLKLQKRIDEAARRILLAWLRLDPDRGSFKCITDFQELRTVLTDNGLGLSWIADEAEYPNRNESLFMRRDGGMERDAPTWIKRAQDAIEILETQNKESSQQSGSVIEPDEPAGQTPTASPELQRIAMLYRAATAADLALDTDRNVWDALQETHDPADLPPSFPAFQKQLGRARAVGLLERKREPRHEGRATGKSVIRANQK